GAQGQGGRREYARAVVVFAGGFVNRFDKTALEQAADKGDVRAMINLGYMYMGGYGGVGKDWTKGREWWEKAAAKGDAEAMRKVGVSYEVDQDYAKAREWYEKAAAKGDTDRAKLDRAKLKRLLEQLPTNQPAGGKR